MEAAGHSGFNRPTSYKLLRERKISAKKRGRAMLVVVAMLSAYLLADLPEYMPGIALNEAVAEQRICLRNQPRRE